MHEKKNSELTHPLFYAHFVGQDDGFQFCRRFHVSNFKTLPDMQVLDTFLFSNTANIWR